MLQLITGRSGSGKTTAIYRELKERASRSEPLFLLVPEQASYENERQLLTVLGPILAQRVQVISFTRMVNLVFREIGGISGKRMDTTVSLLLMNQALHSVADSLSVYTHHIDSPEYLQTVCQMLAECKQCLITPALLEETAATLPAGLLRNKLTDLSFIFGAYDALVTQAALIDPQDDLTWLADKLPCCRAFENAYVYVDGFKGFTRQELLVLERLMPRVATLTVTLCAENITQRAGQEFDRFATAISTAAELRDAAYRAKIKIAAVRHLTENHRTDDPALLVLERGCFVPDCDTYTEPTRSVCTVACTDRTEECRYVARLIRRLLREEGGFCRDFTIVARDLNAYTDLIDSALRREGIPCCRDYREPILTQPLITFVQSALAVITGDWSNSDVLRLTKTGLAGFSTASASLLENYVFLWNIRGRAWRAPFEHHPDGLTATESNDSTRRLAYLNILRKRLANPLDRFAQRLRGLCNGKEFAEAVYKLLQEMRVPRTIRFQVARLDAQGEHALADAQTRLWDYLVSLLDKFATALADTRLSATRFAELFHLAVSTDDLGSIPQGLDGVVIGAADRIRYTRPQTVIVLGANEGVFPAYPAAGGMLTDYERRQLIDAGLPMTNSIDHQTAEERFYAYAAIAAPSKRLVVTYAARHGREPLLPSSLVAMIHRLLPDHARDSGSNGDCESEDDAFTTLAAHYRENTAAVASYREAFCDKPAYADRLAAMQRLENGFAFERPAEARRLFGEHLRLSPSQVETFHQCRFAYFCKYGLRAKPRKTAELNAAEAGTLVHHLLYELLPRYCEAGLSSVTRAQINADTAAAVQNYVETTMGGADNKEARFRALIARLTYLCENVVWRVVCELRDSRFTPVDYELPIGNIDENGNGIAPWVVTLPDGTTVQVRGVVDRVDAFRKDGKTYLRILDYKTGNKIFDLAEVLEGINLQMLIYLFSICENGKSRYGDIVPSGVLYLPAKIPVIKVERTTSAEEIQRQQLKTMRMNGLLLDDEDVLRAMEPELGGLFIPVSLTAQGNLKTDDLVTLEQFGKIKKHIEQLLTAMAQQLHGGDIAALPKTKANGGICAYCDYHDICGRESSDPMKEIASLSLKDALAELKEVESDE